VSIDAGQAEDADGGHLAPIIEAILEDFNGAGSKRPQPIHRFSKDYLASRGERPEEVRVLAPSPERRAANSQLLRDLPFPFAG
jgi:hypothetical protein